jgi:hypothetical protein
VNALGLAELADRSLMESSGWSVLVVEEPRIATTTEELRDELAFLLEDEGVGNVRLFAEPPPGPALVDELARMGPEDVALLPLTADRIAPASRSLEYGRVPLDRGPRGVIVTSEASVQVLAAEAPSFWSWVGGQAWSLVPDVGHLDVEARLRSLREGTGLRDTDVIERAEAGTLAPDPVFAEWLVLLGRGDLLGH